jgi:nucleoside diphosphate kinase
MTSGQVVVAIPEKENAVADYREVNGGHGSGEIRGRYNP